MKPNEINLDFVRMVQAKAELRKRNELAEEYMAEVSERELHIPTGYLLLVLIVALLVSAIVFGGAV